MRIIAFGLLCVCLLSPVVLGAVADSRNVDEAEMIKAEPQEVKEDLDKGADEEAPAAGELLLWAEIPMVVTASHREEPITEAPNAMFVITAEDIRASGMTRLGDLFRLVPGMDVGQDSTAMFSISVRGFHNLLANKLQVLVDGRSLYDPIYAGTDWEAWPIFLEDIERIEVIRGPGGVAWGPNAVNGVINIFTKKPKDIKGGFVKFTYGSRDAYVGHLRYADVEGKLAYRVSAGYLQDAGFEREYDPSRGTDIKDFIRTPKYDLQLQYDLGPQTALSVAGGYRRTDYGRSESSTLGQASGVVSETNYVHIKLDHKIEDDNRIKARYYRNQYRRSFERFPAYRYTQHGVSFQHTFRPAEKHMLVWGAEGRWDIIDTSESSPALTSPADAVKHAVGIFIEDRYQICDRWTLVAGGRADYNEYTGWEGQGRLAVLFEPAKGHVLRAAVSRAVRIPSYQEDSSVVYIAPTGSPFLPYAAQMIGNRGLQSEQLMAYEVGYRGQIGRRLTLNVEGFVYDYSDISTVAVVSSGLPLVYQYRDISDVFMYGGEVSAEYILSPSWKVFGHYAYEDFSWGTGSFKDTAFSKPPRHKFSVGARWQGKKGWSANIQAFYTGSYATALGYNSLWVDIDPYVRLDARLAKTFNKGKSEIAVGVTNLLDEGHPETGSGFNGLLDVPGIWYIQFMTRL